MEDIRATISSSCGKYSDTFILTDTDLTWNWKNGKDSGERHRLLSDMAAQVSHSTSRPNGTEPKVYSGIALITFAHVIFFSALQSLAPLLAPFILIVGVILFIRGIKNWRVETYTHFRIKDEESFGWIVHRHCNAQQLEQFEAEYESACASARFLDN